MKIIDRSGTGFWLDLLVRRKSADIVVGHNFVPDPVFMEAIGREAVSSIKGGPKHVFSVVRNVGRGGKKIHHGFTAGTYRYGIIKGTSPDGKPYEPLKDSTLRIRSKVKSIARGATFILRETSKHILEGLKLKKIQTTGSKFGNRKITIGWTGQDEELVMLNEKDRTVPNPITIMKPEMVAPPVKVPARRVRGFSIEFQENFFRALHEYFG